MEAPAAFSVLHLDGDAKNLPRPERGPYYVIAANGMFAVTKNHFGYTLTPVDEIPSLSSAEAMFWHDVPRIPAQLIMNAWSFFAAIFLSKHTEAMVDITYGPEPHGYRLFVPEQKVSFGGVEAKRNPLHYKGSIVGTIHSHCDFTAYHSGTDEHDADEHDGLHITIGHVNQLPLPEFAVMFSRAKHRWDKLFKIEDVIDGDLMDPAIKFEHPKWWERFVTADSGYSGYKSKTKPTGSVTSFGSYKQSKPSQHDLPSWLRDDDDDTYGLAEYFQRRKFANIDTLVRAGALGTLPDAEIQVLSEVQDQYDQLEWLLEKAGIEATTEFSRGVQRDPDAMQHAITIWNGGQPT